MAYSSIVGADVAPTHPSGREADLLGPSDNSDSGSDTVGTSEAHRGQSTPWAPVNAAWWPARDGPRGRRHPAGQAW